MLNLLLSLLSGVNFAPDEPSGSAAPVPAPGDQSGDTQPDPTPPPSPPAPAPGQQSGDGGGTRTLTAQAFNERIEQAQRSGQRELLRALGFENLDTDDGLAEAQSAMGELLTFAREQQRAQLSAEERVQADLDAATRRADSAERRATTAESRATALEEALVSQARDGALLAAASGTPHPDDVVIWARAYAADHLAAVIDASALFDEDGTLNPAALTVNQPAVEAILTACKQARPEWFRGRLPGVPSNAGGRPPTNPEEIKERQVAAARQTATM